MTNDDKKPDDEVAPQTPQSGEHICPRCKGRGRLEQGPCPSCRGTGKVASLVGNA